MQVFGWRQCISDKRRNQSCQRHPLCTRNSHHSRPPPVNTVKNMPTHTETTAEFLMFEQRVCCIKIVLPKKEMPALSVAIQRRKVAQNGATKQRPLAVAVVMDQHSSQYLLLIIGQRIVRVANEIMEKQLVGGVHFRTLTNCRTTCEHRRRRAVRGDTARTD